MGFAQFVRYGDCLRTLRDALTALDARVGSVPAGDEQELVQARGGVPCLEHGSRVYHREDIRNGNAVGTREAVPQVVHGICMR